MQTTAPRPADRDDPAEANADDGLTDAERVRNARHDRGLTQPQLAELVGVSRQMIATIETGRTGVPYKRRVAFMDALGIDLPRRPPGYQRRPQ